MAREALLVFLRLGVTSFGGPVAHIGYFRAELVERRRWLDDHAFAELVGLCQFLPGPASSQAGFALGLVRAGPLGGLAAFVGFTLPSPALLVAFAMVTQGLAASPAWSGALHGLKLVAVAVVAQAIWSMARTLCPDRSRATIALAAAVAVTVLPVSAGQVVAIAAGALAGLVLGGGTAVAPGRLPTPIGHRGGMACLAAFALLLAGLPLLHSVTAQVFDAFFRTGALVFGGGHVVLPLLHDRIVTPGWVTEAAFFDGYGAAQAVPGPLFTVAAYLGAVMRVSPGRPGGVVGATIATGAIFLPGLLLVAGVLPFWTVLRARPGVQAAMHGANAAVVGLLGAALYDPLWTGVVLRPADFALALTGFVLLTAWRVSPLWIVAGLAGAGAVMGRMAA